MMNLATAYVLITGGSDGIGRALAERYLAAGSRVMVTGRSREKLDHAASALPGLLTFVNDVSDPGEREALATHLRREMPELSVVINNAGIQRRISLADDDAPWSERQREIDTLLSAPIHLNSLLVPLMLGRERALIVNVTSGGGYIPQVFAPVYSACKAALHSYTVTLRHALTGTPIRVVELIPPAVRTALIGSGVAHGAPLDEFADKVFADLADESMETVGFGPTDTPEFRQLIAGSDALFAASSRRFSVTTYSTTPRRGPAE